MKIDKNFVVIVTGGSSGLGQATVRLLRSLQAQTIFVDLNQIKGKKLAEQLNCDFLKVDVSDQKSVIELFQYTIKKYGKIDAVVNCAGIFIPCFTISPDKKVGSSQNLLKILKINVIGTFNVSKYAAKYMASQPQVNGQRGVIINVSSVLAEDGKTNHVIYSATKGAISGMTLPMARDLGRNKIRVMTIAPGIFDTPMNAQLPQQIKKQIIGSVVPIGKEGQPSWFAMSVRDIIQNPYVSGSVWRLDGGIRVPNF